MLSFLEKEMVVETSQKYFDGIHGKLLFKVISNYLANTTELEKELKHIDDTIFLDEEKMEFYSRTIISYMADVATNAKSLKVYTTGQLSKYFGVSITTINNWINEERFIGLESKEKHKQSRINENVLWKSSNGELISIKEVVNMHNRNKIESVSKEEEYDILMSEIKYFENKYKGSYDNTLKIKEIKTDDEKRDEGEWRYLLNRIKK